VVDNAVRHAYPREPGPIWARLCVTPPTGSPTAGPLVSIEIRDRGRGFDAPRALARAHAPAGHAAGGLARAAALCEYLRISSNSAGTAVRLDFELAPSTFEEDGIDQLYERDWLDPIAAKRALAAAMLGASPDEFGLSPAMAVTIGRLLAGPTGAQALRTALWSDSRGEAA
jgi:hypothetical protein